MAGHIQLSPDDPSSGGMNDESDAPFFGYLRSAGLSWWAGLPKTRYRGSAGGRGMEYQSIVQSLYGGTRAAVDGRDL